MSPEKGMRRRPAGLVILGALLAFLSLSAGCGTGYYMHLAAGQFKLLFGAVPVEEALRGGNLSPEERDRLLLVARVKRFGEQSLGLKSTGSYETVYLKSRQNPLFTISASPKDRLTRVTWWFPIVGEMPYLGFFDLESARKKKTELDGQDLDVMISKAGAYSTLGWFKDPVTLNLLEETPAELAETILHEMTHATLYAKGQGDFNEGLAMLVGLIGAARFFEQEYGPSHPFSLEAEDAVKDERTFSSFLEGLMKRLEGLYGSSLPYGEKLSAREQIFAEAKEEFNGFSGKLRTDRYAGFGAIGLNNAYLMSLALYHRHFLLFESFLAGQGGSVPGTLSTLKEMAAKKEDLLGEMRQSRRSEISGQRSEIKGQEVEKMRR